MYIYIYTYIYIYIYIYIYKLNTKQYLLRSFNNYSLSWMRFIYEFVNTWISQGECFMDCHCGDNWEGTLFS